MELNKREFLKVLIVEGGEDKHFVISLMKNYVDWPDITLPPPIFVDDRKGVDRILSPGSLTAELKGSNVRTLGVIVDADDDPQGRYDRIRSLILELFPDMPLRLPATGLNVINSEEVRFGLWLMPDNVSRGALESLIERMVPPRQDTLWSIAGESVAHAQNSGASVRAVHALKARLYTWLAWQDPPGYSPGNALVRNMLNRQSQSCRDFVHWFSELFELPLRTSGAPGSSDEVDSQLR